MLRLGAGLAAVVCCAATARAQTAVVSVESSQQMFAVLCALQSAGYESDINPATRNQVRAKLRPELLAKRGEAVDQLRAFYKDHELAEGSATLSRYVSFALVAGPPPKFDFVVPHDQLPPDVLALEGFNEILATYYRDAEIEKLWKLVQPYYAREARRMELSIADSVTIAAAYMREILKPDPAHNLTIYVEPMVGARTNFRNYGGKYALVVDPGREIALDEAGHSFLHFMLDYLPLRFRAPVAGRKPLLDVATRAPRLTPELREDFTALLTECLIRAVELKLKHLPAAQRQAALDAAEGEGYLLERAIYLALDHYEKSEQPLRSYYPELVAGLDFTAEAKRLAAVEFNPLPAADQQAAAAHAPPPPPGVSELDRWLAEGKQKLDAQDPTAVDTFERILAKYPDVPRAELGLATALLVRGDVHRAKSLLEKVIGEVPVAEAADHADPQTLAWAHIWLARIYDVEERRDLAVPEYRAALSVNGAPDSARSAAQRGLEKP